MSRFELIDETSATTDPTAEDARKVRLVVAEHADRRGLSRAETRQLLDALGLAEATS